MTGSFSPRSNTSAKLPPAFIVYPVFEARLFGILWIAVFVFFAR